MAEINLRKNILISGSYRILLLIVSFLFSWISARYLGVELKGKMSYLITIGGFIWMVLDLGLYRSFPYLVRKFPENTGVLFTWSITSFIVETCILILAGFLMLSFWSAVFDYNFSIFQMLFLVMFITCTKLFMQLQSLYMGLNEVTLNAHAFLVNSMTALFVLLAGYLFFHTANPLTFVMISTLSAFLVGLIFLTFKGAIATKISKVNLRFVLSAYGYGFRAFLSSLFIMLLIKADIVLVKKMLGFNEVGIYSIAAHIVDMLQMLSNLVGGLLLVKLADTQDNFARWAIMRKILMVFFVLLAFVNLGFVAVGKTVLGVMFGVQFIPVYDVYLWLIPASFGLSFGSLFNQYLNSKGFPLVSIILPALAFILNILLNLLLIPNWGINGAALATSIAYLFWFIAIVAYEQAQTQNRMIKHLIPSIKEWKVLFAEACTTLKDAVHKEP